MALNVLLIEQDEVFRARLANVLTKSGFTVRFLDPRLEDIKNLNLNDYLLICIAEEIDGIDCAVYCQNIRMQYHNKNIPLVVMSNEYELARELITKNLGVTEVFSKKDLSRFKRFIVDLIRRVQQNINISNKHILVLEDNQAMLLLIRNYLNELEVEITAVTSAEEAVEKINTEKFDMILADMFVEGEMSGLDLLRIVRGLSHPAKSRIPFLGISGVGDLAIRLEFLNSGANDFLGKPFLFEELVVRMKNLLMIKHLFDRIDEQNLELQKMAVTDHLTGLPNRHCLNMMAPKYLCDSKRHGFPLSMLVIDIDHFKKINDNYGHLVGDMVLVGVSHCIKDYFREEDFPVRFGGEEFIVMMPHCNQKDASKRAEMLREKIELLNPSGINVTVSIGVSELGSHQDFNELFKDADALVYKAKKNGRNRVVTV